MSPVECSRGRTVVICGALTFLLTGCGKDEATSNGVDDRVGSGGAAGRRPLSPEQLGSGLVPISEWWPQGGRIEPGNGSGGASGQGGNSGGDAGKSAGGAGGISGTAGSAGAEAPSHGCDDASVITQTTVLTGVNFSADFVNGNDFGGSGCARAGAASPDAVFSVRVRAGETVILRESARDYSIESVMGFGRSCGNSVECVASRAENEFNSWLGVNYTAEEDETITAFVSSERNHAAPYRISIEYPESLGNVGPGATLPVQGGEALEQDDWRTFRLDVTEPVVVYGELKSQDQAGDLDFRAFHGSEYLSVSFEPGDESVAFGVPTGQHFVEVRAYEAVNGYSLSLFTDPFRILSAEFDLTENSAHVHQESAAISAGRSLFYRLSIQEDAALRIKVQADGGDPVLSLYEASGHHYRTWQASQSAEEFLVTRVSAPASTPAVVVLRVQAAPEGGDMSSHRVEISVAAE